jgi:acyl-CoA dehydrogenase
VHSRFAFGAALASKGTIIADIARSRVEIDQCRLLTLQAAATMDQFGNKAARQQIAMIKVAAPEMVLRVLDRGA